MNPLSRTQLLAAIRSAAFHGEDLGTVEIFARSVLSPSDVDDARDQGAYARSLGIPCACGRCRRASAPLTPFFN